MNEPLPIAEAQRALDFIPADVPRDSWVKVGMALRSEYGDDAFQLFDDWSQRGTTYNQHDARNTWKSLRGSGIGIGTLIREAQANGFEFNKNAPRPNPADMDRLRREREAKMAQEAAEHARLQEQAAQQAAAIWKVCAPAESHPYLELKGIPANKTRIYRGGLAINGMRCDGALVVPLWKDGVIRSLQFISSTGEKRYLPNGEKSGCYFAIGTPDGQIVAAEGFATASTIHQATGAATAVTFDAGNLCPVVNALRSKYPDIQVVVAADNDQWTKGNPGVTKAREAAKAVNGLVAIPEFDDLDGMPTDFNDLARQKGLQAVRNALAQAATVTATSEQDAAAAQIEPDAEQIRHDKGMTSPKVLLLSAAGIHPEAIQWLWDGFLARRKLHMIAGAPGTGKTTVAVDLASRLSNSGRWPDGSRSGGGNVLIWSGEDSPEDTLVPRLHACGADMDRIFFVGRAVDANGETRPFDPATDMDLLRGAIADHGQIDLLIVDPVVSAVGGDSHKNTEVRRSLQPLVDLAADFNCAVLGISHFSKGTSGRDPVERVTGSVAFGALPRMVMAAAKISDDAGGGRMLARAKSNIAPDTGGFKYDIEQVELTGIPGVFASRVVWGEALEGSARDLLAKAETVEESDERGATEEAVEWLKECFRENLWAPVKVRDAQKDARKEGITDRSLRRAREQLGIKSRKRDFKEGWIWDYPEGAPRGHEDAPLKKGAPSALGAPSAVSPHGSHAAKGPLNHEAAPITCGAPSGPFGRLGDDGEAF